MRVHTTSDMSRANRVQKKVWEERVKKIIPKIKKKNKMKTIDP